MQTPRELFSYRRFWAKRLLPAPVLPMSRAEMEQLGWDSCDVILVTGDAYVDHPSYGMAIIGRLLESQGFRVGIIAQPDWRSAAAFKVLGRPNLFFGVTAGNMDSMVNRYTADRKIRSDDAYSPDGEGGRRPDRAVIVYAQRCREAYKEVPLVIGGIEASLRRIAHYDYWSDTVRRSILVDAKADLLLYGNAERAIVELAHRLAAGNSIETITDLRGSAFFARGLPQGWTEIRSTTVDEPGAVERPRSPYETTAAAGALSPNSDRSLPPPAERETTVVRLPAFEQVKGDKVLYAHASRVMHLETNPGNARALMQRHGERDVWLNPPAVPLTTKELDRLYEFPYTRKPHPAYGEARFPGWEMIRFSVPIMRGCFGGCTFCSITEHEGRIIQNRSEDSIIREVEAIRDHTPGFTGIVSDLGGPTANMWRLGCKEKRIEAACRRFSCVFPELCNNLETDQTPLVRLYRRARDVGGVKRVLIASGVRYDLALRTPSYVKELVTHHVGGYLKIAPEHTEEHPLSLMMKPGIGVYDKFKAMFDKYSREAGKEQYLIPYFIAAHPGSSDEDMVNLALWLKKNNFRLDQVQTFLPSPMALATAMYHTGRNPLKRVHREGGAIPVATGLRVRRLHKAFLRYHDPQNWPVLREALKRLGRAELIGNGKRHLIPLWQPAAKGNAENSAPGRKGGRPGNLSSAARTRKPTTGKKRFKPADSSRRRSGARSKR